MEYRTLLADAYAERDRLQRELDKVGALINALTPLAGIGAVAVEEVASYPKPRAAVLEAIRTRPDEPLAAREVTALVRELGLFNPHLKSRATAYSTALSRLSQEKDSGVLMHSDGRYIYDPFAVNGVVRHVSTADTWGEPMRR